MICCFPFRNRNAELLFGYSESEALGRSIFELVVRKEHFNAGYKIISNLVRTGEQWNGQFPLLKKSGEVFLGLVTNTLIYDDNGETAGVVGVSHDARLFSSSVGVGRSLQPFTIKTKQYQQAQGMSGMSIGSSLSNMVDISSRILRYVID